MTRNRGGVDDDETEWNPGFDPNTTVRSDGPTEQEEGDGKQAALDGTTQISKPLDVGDSTTQVSKPLDLHGDSTTAIAKPLLPDAGAGMTIPKLQERPSAELTPVAALAITPLDLGAKGWDATSGLATDNQRALAATAGVGDDDVLTGQIEKLRRITSETPYSPFPAVEPEIPIGTMLGDYRVTGKVAQGGFGVVLSAVHPKIGKRAAIKVLKKQLCKDADTVQRFTDEARVVNQIRHPNIVDVFAFGETPDGRSFLAMEWLEGQTLRARIAKKGRLELAEICEVMRPLLRALMAAHTKNIVHRDLKPDNIFLVDVPGEPPFVKLLDFGIAKLLHDDARVSLTASGALLGTPLYMAPEQGRAGVIDKAADVYALGVILFEMVTGEPPFTGENAIEVVAKHLVEKPPRPSSLVTLPRKLEDLILAMLEKEASYRPRLDSVSDIIEGLRERVDTKPASDSFRSEAPTDQATLQPGDQGYSGQRGPVGRAKTDPAKPKRVFRADPSQPRAAVRADPSQAPLAPRRTPISGIKKIPSTPTVGARKMPLSVRAKLWRRRARAMSPAMRLWLLVGVLAFITFVLITIVLRR